MTAICMNGSIIFDDAPAVYADDRGFLLGDGLFETIKAVNGHLVFFDRHYVRLHESARILGIPLIDDQCNVKKNAEQLLQINELVDQTAAIRITLTRGRGARGISCPSAPATLMITAAHYVSPLNKPIRMMLTDVRRNEYSVLTRLKTLCYLESVMARKQATDKGFDEGMMLNTTGYLTESSIANVFFIQDNRLITPPVTDGVLPGILRQLILDYCRTHHILVEERSVSPDELPLMTAAFQSNSLVGIQIIACFDDCVLPETHNNSLAQLLIKYLKDIEKRDEKSNEINSN